MCCLFKQYTNTPNMFPKNEIYVFYGSPLHIISTTKDVLYIPNTNEIYLGKFIQMGPLSHNGKIIQNGIADFQYGSIRFLQYSEVKISTIPIKIYNNNIEPMFTYESLYGQ